MKHKIIAENNKSIYEKHIGIIQRHGGNNFLETFTNKVAHYSKLISNSCKLQKILKSYNSQTEKHSRQLMGADIQPFREEESLLEVYRNISNADLSFKHTAIVIDRTVNYIKGNEHLFNIQNAEGLIDLDTVDFKKVLKFMHENDMPISLQNEIQRRLLD